MSELIMPKSPLTKLQNEIQNGWSFRLILFTMKGDAYIMTHERTHKIPTNILCEKPSVSTIESTIAVPTPSATKAATIAICALQK